MTPTTLRLSVRSGDRLPRFPGPGDDERLGMTVWALVEEAIGKRRAPPAVFVFTDERVHVVDLRPAVPTPRILPRLVGSLAGVDGAEALALVGVLTRRKGGLPPWQYAVAFLEWPDGRWWLAQRRVADDGTGFLDAFEVEVQRAVDDLPRPGGLGGWFTRARVEGLTARIDSHAPHGSDLVN